MKLYVFPPSSRSLGVLALVRHLAIDCELVPVDLSRGDHRADDYAAVNRNRKVPSLVDGDLVLWEANAILFYLAQRRQDGGMWPTDAARQADVLRWLFWESAHWDAESIGMASFEVNSKRVLGLSRVAVRRVVDRGPVDRRLDPDGAAAGLSGSELPRDRELVRPRVGAAGVAGRARGAQRGDGRARRAIAS